MYIFAHKVGTLFEHIMYMLVQNNAELQTKWEKSTRKSCEEIIRWG